MFSKTFTISALVASLAVLDSSAAKGINCEGSGLCARASWDNTGVGSVMQGLRDALYSTNISDTTSYAAGDHVICVSQSQPISITASASASVPDVPAEKRQEGSISATLTGSIGNGGVCVFPQNSGVTLAQARTLMDGLLEHKCTTCGSNPINPGNNDATGELTVNYVAAPYCVGNCISSEAVDTTGTNPTAGTTSKRDELVSIRWGKRGERLRLE